MCCVIGVFVYILVCPLVFFYSRVVCANEWGRWSVHFDQKEKGRGVRMRGIW